MKLKSLKFALFIASSLLVFSACKKKETIIEEYNPPALQIYGTWLEVNADPTDSSKTYTIFDEKKYGIVNYFYQDNHGFKSTASNTYYATDKQIIINGAINNYTIIGDTFKVYYNETIVATTYVKQKVDVINTADWLGTISFVGKSIELPSGYSANITKTIGINGDFLYINLNTKLYKYNTLNKRYTDSFSLAAEVAGCLFYNGNVYRGDYDEKSLVKMTANLGTIFGGKISTNPLPYCTVLSVNSKNSLIYAYSKSENILYSGTDGSNFNVEFDFSQNQIYINSALYYNGKFIVLKNRKISIVELSPFKVVRTYEFPNGENISELSVDGKDIWAAYYKNGKYQFSKITLN